LSDGTFRSLNGAAPAMSTPAVDDKTFALIKSLVPPTATEDDFDKIPWLTSIWAARQKAAKEGKPILLWEMDGHPLGCG